MAITCEGIKPDRPPGSPLEDIICAAPCCGVAAGKHLTVSGSTHRAAARCIGTKLARLASRQSAGMKLAISLFQKLGSFDDRSSFFCSTSMSRVRIGSQSLAGISTVIGARLMIRGLHQSVLPGASRPKPMDTSSRHTILLVPSVSMPRVAPSGSPPGSSVINVPLEEWDHGASASRRKQPIRAP